MSGITPLLDTLLHQVLGKRADVPPPRELNQPVKPVSPGDAPRALHSDSRLDARAPPGRAGPAAQDPRRAAAPVPVADTASPSSTHTHFSTTARTIADLLLRFPAPTSAVTPAAPLLSIDRPISPTLLAQRLENSVRDSGLFYESHLARWFTGGLSRQQLEREPQMWRTLIFTPAPSSRTGGAPLLGPATDAGEARVLHSALADVMTERREPVDPHLQGLVRHQLEMLVSPTLRWEGDVWAGMFMALAVHLPHDEQERRRGDDESRSDDDKGTLSAELTLDVEGLGAVSVALRMGATTLDVTLRARDETILADLEAELATLRQRLKRHGFDHVRLSLAPWREEGT
ncbi:flagellar hook-length control protein FliK [Halomonas elongata]|uniref:flagellar hook-length control protein FliK n=1 Tax=Halomonas elongata TaxID=2746 RepID=UPI002E296B51|nr:flagellar hook-length control protein FliK [Halomonas elongata]WVI71564.1 flagellar hook-length control protein FliK [Halomonas elongata]